MFSPIRRAHEPNSQSPVLGELRDLQIVLLSDGLGHLIKGSERGGLSEPPALVFETEMYHTNKWTMDLDR